MTERQFTSLGGVVRLKRGYDLPDRVRRTGSVPVLGSFGVTGWHDQAKRQGPGVTIGRSGASIGVAAFHDGPFWPLNTTLYVTDFMGNAPRFVYYLLDWLDFHDFNSGSAQPSLNRNYLDAIPVPHFTRDEQEQIADILGSIDDLIENNRQRVEVLEEMARAIYREWFVHFRYPGHEDVPLVDSPLGPIPDGWEDSTLGASGRWLSGGTPKTSVSEYWGGPLPWITSGTLTSILLDRSERTLTDAGASNGTKVVDRNTVLFVVRGMSLIREFRVGIADVPLAFGQDCKAIVANEGIEPLYLGFNLIDRAHDIQGMVELAGHGTGKLSTDRLKALPLVRPAASVQRAFVEFIAPIRDSLTSLRLATDNLAAIRDLLLPKLVTGQIDVSHLDLDVLAEVTTA